MTLPPQMEEPAVAQAKPARAGKRRLPEDLGSLTTEEVQSNTQLLLAQEKRRDAQLEKLRKQKDTKTLLQVHARVLEKDEEIARMKGVLGL